MRWPGGAGADMGQPGQGKLQRHELYLIPILLLAALLGMLNLGARSFWPDELYSAEIIQHPLTTIWQQAGSGDVHPPFYYMALSLWMRSFGDGEAALRLFSVIASLAALPLAFAALRRIGRPGAALLATFWLAVSPFILLYSRMARYYSLAMLLGLGSTLLFLKLLEEGSPRRWLTYGILSLALLYTDYPASSLILAQNLYLFLQRKQLPPRLARKWLVGQFILGLLYLPWLGTLLGQVGMLADWSRVPTLKGVAYEILSLLYPFYDFSVGETIYPWNPLALGGLLLVGGGFILGLLQVLRRQGRLSLALFILGTALAVLLGIAWGISSIPFVNLPARAMFAVPFFYLIVAEGWWAVRSRKVKAIAILGLVVVNGYSLANYYLGREFINPISLVPTREVVALVAERSQPQDILVSDQDTGFAYYYAKLGWPGDNPHLFSQPAAPIVELAQERPQARIWLFTYGRDSTYQAEPKELLEWLEANYRLAEVYGYGEESPLYRRMKGVLTTREPYQFKALLRLFTPKGG